MRKQKYVIPIISVLLLTGCKSENIKLGKVADLKEQNTDNTFIMIKNEQSDDELLSEIYVKYDGKDKNKIASDIPKYNKIDYLEGKKAILVQDDENNLVKFDSEGEKEIIGKELIETDNGLSPYKVSSNNETVAYLTEERSLYIKEKDKDKDKVANNVWDYKIDSIGKNVYYINDENNLYIYSDGNSEKISSDVTSFKISSNGEIVVFSNNEENLYIKNINSEDKEKINSGTVEISSVKIYEDGIITFLSDFDYDDYKGELYIYDGKDKNKIASDVIQYIKQDDKFYFINEDKTLYEKSLKDEKSNKLLSDVEYIRSINDGIIYINVDGNIYSKKNGKDAIKIGKNIMSEELLNIVNDEEIIYLTENNDLFIGEDKIAKEVINYVYNSEIISYVTEDNKVHSYNLKEKKDIVEIENAKDYSYIYLEDQLVFSNSLESYELAGFWKSKHEDEVVEFSGSNKMTLYFKDDFELEKSICAYDVEYSDENTMNIKIEEMTFTNYEGDKATISIESDSIIDESERYFTISKKDDKNIIISYEGEPTEFTKISKAEADKIIKEKSTGTVNKEENNKNDAQLTSNNDDYIIYDSDTRLLTEDELSKYSKNQLKYIRNEIFARYGYVFKSEDLNNYFSKKSWYNPDINIEATIDILNGVEKYNVELIKELEGK